MALCGGFFQVDCVCWDCCLLVFVPDKNILCMTWHHAVDSVWYILYAREVGHWCGNLLSLTWPQLKIRSCRPNREITFPCHRQTKRHSSVLRTSLEYTRLVPKLRGHQEQVPLIGPLNTTSIQHKTWGLNRCIIVETSSTSIWTTHWYITRFQFSCRGTLSMSSTSTPYLSGPSTWSWWNLILVCCSYIDVAHRYQALLLSGPQTSGEGKCKCSTFTQSVLSCVFGSVAYA